MNVIKLIQGAVLIAACAVPIAPLPAASAQPCADVEVVFARGTYEPPGIGGPGQTFVDALRARARDRSVDVYPVNYAASGNFGDRIEFARTVVDGIRDAANHIQATARDCPNTKVVLGGYSQGAVVAGFVTSAAVPAEIPAEYQQFIPQPMPPEVSDHVASVVLLGKPSAEFMRDIGAPALVIGPRYKDKTIELCEPGDTICDGTPAGVPSFAHGAYVFNGMPAQAADFTVNRLKS
ncbi:MULTISPECIES: cutinase family protein [unclassified Mycolicibacterium]|uniref:cutinase family protein n=1 Tax=unclassified Mycolicibacterium TaxID=2636767 RepID=UPI0012DEECD3|nr:MULTISPECIES: cutinase family protein [unclassified Mycolicibacterium]MUL83902.1 cutinase family protein [Mycolicibacterium sp. CBMA 329]MUL90032.1 cutinase family protein [Mycolicibacterium sp. CBMA 331]MUL97948.1 cutinase family protein [Mycolicibacterium sp. CBMA 334]MUM27883.1 cutinase family protein [Mycolicibacterium sp. CBMA 295]MUM39547.1 cutinase family protein [Mycolicibacterium sp. CBMA 247]